MAWPHNQDYNEAIQYPDISLSDPELRQGEVTLTALGLPRPFSGNFADVYQIVCPRTGRSWAVKCFTREVPYLRQRYAAIAEYLKDVQLPFLIECDYQEHGIRVHDQWYPIVKMPWVEGQSLNTFVQSAVDRPQVLNALSQVWVRMAYCLDESAITHADLQHGNVLLIPGNNPRAVSIKLVDYDGMIVPGLANSPSGEFGHAAFQHPQRKREGIYSTKIDRFSILVVYTSLQGLMAKGPALWERFDNGDNLLFQARDFEAPTKSPLFYELLKVDNPRLRRIVEILIESCRGLLEDVPALHELVDDWQKVTAVASVQTKVEDSTIPEAIYNDSTRAGFIAAPAAVVSSTPILESQPSSEPAKFRFASYWRTSRWRSMQIAAVLVVVFMVLAVVCLGLSNPSSTDTSSNSSNSSGAPHPIAHGSTTPKSVPDHENPSFNMSATNESAASQKAKSPTNPSPKNAAEKPIPPKLNLHGEKKISEGSTYVLQFQMDPEPSSGRDWKLLVDWGDGKRDEYDADEKRVSHFYADGPALRLVSVSIKDTKNNNVLDTQTKEVEVTNVRPMVGLKGAKTSLEGSSYELHVGPITDVGADTATKVTVNWGDGKLDTLPAHAKTVTHQYLDNGEYTISAAVTDEDGVHLNAGTFKVRVENVAPKVRLSGPLVVFEGSPYTLRLEQVFDPGEDRIEKFIVDWGDKTEEYEASKREFPHTFGRPADNLRIVVHANDEDGQHLNAGWIHLRAVMAREIWNGDDNEFRALGGGRWARNVQGRITILQETKRTNDFVELQQDKDTTFQLFVDQCLITIGKRGVQTKLAGHWSRHINAMTDVAHRGLRAEYFRGNGFDKQKLVRERIDSQINWDWPISSKMTPKLTPPFSVRWQGALKPPEPGDYQLSLETNGEVKLWLGQEWLINRSSNTPVRLDTPWKMLTDEPIEIRVEFQTKTLPALIRLRWRKKDGFGDEIVPAEAFFQDIVKARGAVVQRPQPGATYRTLLDHAEAVAAVVVSSDGRFALTGGGGTFSQDGKWNRDAKDDFALRYWHLDDGKVLHVLKGHTSAICSVAFSQDDRKALTGGRDKTVRLWDLEFGASLHVFKGHTDTVSGVLFHPDGQRAISASHDGSIRIWDLKTGVEVGRLDGRAGPVECIALHPNGLQLIACVLDGSMMLWDLEKSRIVHRFPNNQAAAKCIAFSPNGSRFITGGQDGLLRVWSLESRRELAMQPLEAHSGPIWSLAFARDGKRVLSSSSDGSIRLWHVDSGRELRSFHGHQGIVPSIAFSPEGRYALSAGADHRVILWDLSRVHAH